MTAAPHPDGERIRIIGRCIVTGSICSIIVDVEDALGYRADSTASIQDQFPSIRSDRDAVEFLISGMSPRGWEKVFGSDDG